MLLQDALKTMKGVRLTIFDYKTNAQIMPYRNWRNLDEPGYIYLKTLPLKVLLFEVVSIRPTESNHANIFVNGENLKWV